MHVEMFGAAPVAVADVGPGRYQADPAGTDRVLGAAHRQIGLVSVKMQLPQTRQPELVHMPRRTVHSDPDGSQRRRLVEMSQNRLHDHVFYPNTPGENQPL